MAELKTVADVRRMLRGEAAPALSQGEATPPTPAIPPGAVSATVETVDEQPLKTVETVQIIEGGDLTDLSLTPDQLSALEAAGISDRSSLTAAIEVARDKGLPGLSRETVRRLRKQLGG